MWSKCTKPCRRPVNWRVQGIVPDDDAPAPKKKVSDLVLDFLIGTFQPLIGVITGGGLIKTLLTLLTMAGWMDKSSDLYQVMFNIADATFYFLPVMIAYTSATKLKCNKMYAVIIAAVPLLPKLSGPDRRRSDHLWPDRAERFLHFSDFPGHPFRIRSVLCGKVFHQNLPEACARHFCAGGVFPGGCTS